MTYRNAGSFNLDAHRTSFDLPFHGNGPTNLGLNLIPSEPSASLRSTRHVPIQSNLDLLAAASASLQFEQTFAGEGVSVTICLMVA
jgi:hypothetical protein